MAGPAALVVSIQAAARFDLTPCLTNSHSQIYAKLSVDYPALEATGAWMGLEACVQAVKFIARDIPASTETDEKLNQIVSMLLHLQTNAAGWPMWPRLRYTACSFIGSLALLFRRRPQLLSPLFTFLYTHLTVEQTVEAAANAIQHVCERCSEQLGEPVLSLYDQINQEATTLQYLQLKDELSILNGLACVVKDLDLGG